MEVIQAAATIAKRSAQAHLGGVLNWVRANKYAGQAFGAMERELVPLREAGGLRRALYKLRAPVNLESQALRAEREAIDALAQYDLPGYQARLQAARELRAMAEEAAQRAEAIAVAPGRALLAGARTWFLPGQGPGRWSDWVRRMGITAGGAFALGTGYRLFTGNGGPFTNNRGDFDIAGIPFV